MSECIIQEMQKNIFYLFTCTCDSHFRISLLDPFLGCMSTNSHACQWIVQRVWVHTLTHHLHLCHTSESNG